MIAPNGETVPVPVGPGGDLAAVVAEVERLDATAVMLVAESRLTKLRSASADSPPADAPEQVLALTLSAVSKDGEAFVFFAPFESYERKIVLGETRFAPDMLALGNLRAVTEHWAPGSRLTGRRGV